MPENPRHLVFEPITVILERLCGRDCGRVLKFEYTVVTSSSKLVHVAEAVSTLLHVATVAGKRSVACLFCCICT